MAEELRFFLRTALYSAVIAAIYWFASYETAGTVLLVFVVLAAGLAVTVPALLVPVARGGPWHVAGIVNRLLGFEEDRGPAHDQPLTAGPEPIPSSSPWPLLGGVAALLLALGIVFGPWLLAPGIVLIAITGFGWLVQLDPAG